MGLSSVLRTALLGPAYFAHRRLIDASKSWSAAQTHDYQTSMMSRLLDRFGDSIRSKSHYRKDVRRYTTLPLPGIVKRVTTGGTTATPFSFYMDTFARRQKERAYIFDIWAEVGYEPFDLRVVYRGNIGRTLISYDWIENAYAISPAHLNPANVGQVQRFLAGLPPFFLHVYPSSLVSLMDLLGVPAMRSLPIRGILAGSEAFPTEQMRSAEERTGLKVAHWYGHSEYATLAKYCRHCDGFHFYPTYGYTEFVAAESGLHHIVATSFNSIGTHFVRYDTGDLAVLSASGCPEPFSRIEKVVGRIQEYFIGRDGTRYAFGPFLFGIHNRFWDLVTGVQFVQRVAGEMIVRLQIKPDIPHTDRVWAQDFLISRFVPVKLSFSTTDPISKTATGKHRYFVNELTSENQHSATN